MRARRLALAAVTAVVLVSCGGGGGGKPDAGGGNGGPQDLTPPVTSASPAGGTFGPYVIVSLQCTDTGSGCAMTRYSLDAAAATTRFALVTEPIVLLESATLRFYSVDTAGNVEAVQSLGYVVDPSPPVTTFAPEQPAQRQPFTVTLSCSDAVTQCAGTYFTVDGSAPTTSSAAYAQPLQITTTTDVAFFSVDATGNAEAIRSVRFVVDTQPPVLVMPAGAAFKAQRQVAIGCTDDDACAAVHFTLDGTPATTASPVYDGPFTLSATTTLRAIAVDRAGNPSSEGTAQFTLDNTPPVTTASIGGTPWHAPTLTLSCTDDVSGCALTVVRAAGTGSAFLPYSEPLAPTATTVYEFQSYDVAGNLEAVGDAYLYVDHEPPSLGILPANRASRDDITVTLTCHDDGPSGCASVHYTLDGTTPTGSSPAYSAPFKLDETATVRAIAIDNAGHVSQVYTARFLVDRAAAVVTASPPAGAYGDTVTVSLGCDDGDGSGCESLNACVAVPYGNCTPTRYEGPLEITADAWIVAETVDAVGNRGSARTEYVIDRTAPAIRVLRPYAGQTVVPTSTLQVEFTELLDAASVTADTFRVEGVEGTVGVTDHTITFTPSAPLPRNASFNVTIAAGVKDRVGHGSAEGASYVVHSFAAPTRLNTGSLASLRPIGIAADPSGDVLVVWRSETGSGERLWHRTYDATLAAWTEPGSLGTVRRARQPISIPAIPTGVAAATDGGFVVAYGSRSWTIAGGIASAPQPFPDSLRDLQVARTAEGARAVWTSPGSYPSIYGSFFDGVSWDAMALLSPRPPAPVPATYVGAHSARLVSGGAGSLVVWSEDGKSVARHHASTATSVVAPVEGARAAVNDDLFAVAYTQAGATYAALGTPSGWGAATRLDATVTGGDDQVHVAGAGGQFLVTYVQNLTGGPALHTRRFVDGEWEAEQTALSGEAGMRVEAIVHRAGRFGVVVSTDGGAGPGRALLYTEEAAGVWSTPIPLGEDLQEGGRVLATGEGETAWFFWRGGDDSNPLEVARFDATGLQFTRGLATELEGASADAIATAATEDGGVVVWREVLPTGTMGIRATRLEVDTWVGPQTVAEAGTGPRVAAGLNGILVCWTGADGAWTRRFAGGSWEAPVRHAGRDTASHCDVATTDDGFAVVWRDVLSTGAVRILGTAWVPGTGWQPVTLLGDGLQAQSAPRIAAAAGGGFLAAWVTASTAVHARRWEASTGWASQSTSISSTTRTGTIALASNPANTAIFWDAPTGTNYGSTSQVTMRWFDGATWGTERRSSQNYYRVTGLLAAATTGGFVASWRGDSNYDPGSYYVQAWTADAASAIGVIGYAPEAPAALGASGARAFAVATTPHNADRRLSGLEPFHPDSWSSWGLGQVAFEDAGGDPLSPAVLGKPDGFHVLWAQENARGDLLVRDLVFQTVR